MANKIIVSKEGNLVALEIDGQRFGILGMKANGFSINKTVQPVIGEVDIVIDTCIEFTVEARGWEIELGK